MTEVLVQPAVFVSLLAVLSCALVSVAVSLARGQRSGEKRAQSLTAAFEQKDREYRESIAQLMVTLREKEKELGKVSGEFKALSSSVEADQKLLQSLQAKAADTANQMSEKEAFLKKEILARAGVEEKLKTLEDDSDKVKKDLQLSNQMYEGLKGQYDELEEKFSQVFQQFLQEQKKNQLFSQHTSLNQQEAPAAAKKPIPFKIPSITEPQPLPEKQAFAEGNEK